MTTQRYGAGYSHLALQLGANISVRGPLPPLRWHWRCTLYVYQRACVNCMQHVQVIRSSVSVMECVFRRVSYVMATHSVVITAMKPTALTTTVSFICNFHIHPSAIIMRLSIVKNFVVQAVFQYILTQKDYRLELDRSGFKHSICVCPVL